MPFYPSVGVNSKAAVSSGSVSNLQHCCIADVNTYHKAVVTSYYSLADLNADLAVPKSSSAYAAISIALSNASSRNLPIYLGRVEAATTTITPTALNNTVYSLDVQIIDTTDGSDAVAKTTITTTSDADATQAEIVTALIADLNTAVTVEAIVTDNGTSFDVAPAANRQILITDATSNLVQSFTTTKTGTEALADIMEENNEDWYRMTTTVRDNDFIIEMAQAIEATESSDYPKLFHVSSSAPETLVAQTDPSDNADLAGRIEDLDYANTSVEWHDQSNSIYPECAMASYIGSFFVGTKGLKFSANAKVPEARHPVLGRRLTPAEMGFITDRNAIVRGSEMKIPVYITSKAGDTGKRSGWLDNVSISHWIRLTQKLRIFNALVNADNAGLPLTFTRADRLVIAERADSVLAEAVERKMLKGYIPTFVPDSVSFEDQAERTLKDLRWTGYFAGKINFVIVDGVLTYQEEDA